MDYLALLVLALPPGVFWLWFFARRSRYRPIPGRKLAWTFLFGMVAAVPAAMVEVLFIGEEVFSPNGAPLGQMLVAFMLVVGPVEEVSKFGACWLGARRSRYFEEPMDGLVHGVAASLGFATLENFGYMLTFGLEVILVRGAISTLAHVVFGTCWAYALGLHILHPSHRSRVLLLLGLAAAAALHGVYDVAILYNPVLGLAVVALSLLLGLKWTLGRFAWGQRISPFRYRRNYPLSECTVCGGLISVSARFCRFCGASRQRRGRPLVCGQCRRTNRANASFCVQCGDRFVF